MRRGGREREGRFGGEGEGKEGNERGKGGLGERGREGGRKGMREGRREGGRESLSALMNPYSICGQPSSGAVCTQSSHSHCLCGGY